MALPGPPLPARLAEEGFECCGIDAFSPEEIVAFMHGILLADCRMNARKQLESSVSKFFRDFTGESRFFLTLSQDDRLCGFTAVDRYNDRTATLKWIFVSSDHRGKGVGSWLLETALSFARSTCYEKVILCTATSMEDAHHLYRKGFVFKQRVTFWRQRMQVYENILQRATPELASQIR